MLQARRRTASNSPTIRSCFLHAVLPAPCKTPFSAWRQTGSALLLPRMRPIAEGEEDATLIAGLIDRSLFDGDIDLPPAVSELERRLVLMQLVQRWSDSTGGGAADAQVPLRWHDRAIAGAVGPSRRRTCATDGFDRDGRCRPSPAHGIGAGCPFGALATDPRLSRCHRVCLAKLPVGGGPAFNQRTGATG